MADTDFRKKMRLSESSGNYGILTDISGNRQMAGAYQFSAPRLKDYMRATGEVFPVEEFRSDPDLQERVMNWHEQDIMEYVFDKGLDQYIGQTVGGVEIDPAALTGMAHIGGRKGMRMFLQSGGKLNPKDDFKTSIADYGKKFSGSDMYGLTPTRPRMRPAGLVEEERAVRPRARPRGLLD